MTPGTPTSKYILRMAEAGAADNKTHTTDMTNPQERIKCLVCEKTYTYPKTLDCLHSFCISCLRSLSSLNDKNHTVIVCPKCKVKSQVPENDFEAYPDAFHINRWIQQHEFMQKVSGTVPALCEKCSKKKSTKACSYCSDCALFICDLCVTIHRCWTEFQSHQVVNLASLRNSSKYYIPKQIEPLMCATHSKSCSIFCETCQMEICHECIIRTHRDHSYNLSKECAVKHKESLKEALSDIEDIPEQLELAINRIKSICERFTANTQAVVDDAKSEFETLQKQLSDRKDELVKNASELMKEKQKPLQRQLDELKLMKEKATDCLDFISEASSGDHITEFFTLEKQMVTQIKAVKKEFEGLDLMPIEEPVVQLFLKPDIAEEIQAAGNIGDGSILYAGSSEGKYFSVNQIITFYIALSSAYYKSRASPIDQFKADIQSSRDGSICPATIAISSSGFAKLQCSFTERGRYRVNVYTNGKHIIGSPYSFYVTPPPQQFQAPVKTISNLNCPKGIAINPKNQVVITEENRHVVTVFGRKSKKILSFGAFGTEESQFNQPLGVAVDKDGYMYVADNKNNCIKKFHSDGSFASMYSGEKSFGGTLSKPSSVKVDSKGNLYVVDRGNARIVVLNENLKFQLQFGGLGVGLGKLEDPWDLAFDLHGVVYVTDVKQNCIHLFTPEGDFRGRIGSHGTQKGKLNRPTGIAIDRFGRIFVCEAGNHRVSIFHVCSEFMECFSTGLTMVNPCSITIDNDGFVYVTCATCIHIF